MAAAPVARPLAVPSQITLPHKSITKREQIGQARESKRRRRLRSFDLERQRNSFAAFSTSSSSASSSSSSSLARAASAALARSLYPEVVRDPFAALLAEAAGVKKEEQQEEIDDKPQQPPPSAFTAVAAAFADAALLSATDLVNFETGDSKGREYRQVVLLGPGLDTRAQRVEWPPGTVVFECASAEAHSVAAAALASEAARGAFELEAAKASAVVDGDDDDDDGDAAASTRGSKSSSSGGDASSSPSSPSPSSIPFPSSFNGSGAPRGRLLRRVVCDVSTSEGREGLAQALFDSGFRAERLSAWCVNAGALFDDGGEGGERDVAGDLRELFGAVASCAAFCSFVVGDLPAMAAAAATTTRKEAEDVVACSGILGSVVEFGSDDDVAGSRLWERRGWKRKKNEKNEDKDGKNNSDGGDGDDENRRRRQRYLFIGQQRTRSDAELGILAEFSRAAEEAEGFEDNIS